MTRDGAPQGKPPLTSAFHPVGRTIDSKAKCRAVNSVRAWDTCLVLGQPIVQETTRRPSPRQYAARASELRRKDFGIHIGIDRAPCEGAERPAIEGPVKLRSRGCRQPTVLSRAGSRVSDIDASDQVCPRCGGYLERIPRRLIGRLVSKIVLVHRYQCIGPCGWRGNLRVRRLVERKEPTLRDGK
jgi:hypothetical protein